MEKERKELFSEKILEAVACKFGVGIDGLSFIGGFQNFIYEFKKEETSYILRVTHSSHRSENKIRGELDFVEYLHRNDVCVSKPVCSPAGEFTERIKVNDSYFTVSAFEKAGGKKLSYPEYLGSEKMFFELGKITGKIHRLSKSYMPREEAIGRHDWTQNYYIRSIDKFIPGAEYGIHKGLKEVLNEISRLGMNKNSFGLIHGDINIGNFFVNEDRITIFDFDECQYSWFIEDIAIQLYYTIYVILDDTIDEREKMGKKFMDRFMEGYKLENTLEDCWLDTIPLFLRLREIIVHIGIYRSWNLNSMNQWQNDYFKQSRARIEKGIPLINRLM